MAETRYVGCLENVVVPPGDFVAQALATIARSGPHTRLGLTPSPVARLWSWRPEPAPTIRELPTDVAERGTAAVLEYIRRLPIVRSPIDVYLSRRHIAFDIDHGLGDARLYIDCVTTLYEMQQGRCSEWLKHRDTSFPVARALAHTFGTHPRRLRRTWSEAKQLPDTTASRSSESAHSTWSPSCAVEVIHIDSEVEREVERWRATNAAGASRAVTWLVIVRTALAQAGLPLSDAVRLVVDCRRYLPAHDRVNGNFISGLNVTAPLDQHVSEIGAAVRADLEAALPLLAMSVTWTRNFLLPSESPRDKDWKLHTPIQMVYSDVGRLSPFEDLPWRSEGPRSITAALEPGAPSDISVFTGAIGTERSVTLSYHDTVHDRRLLRNASQAIRTDPIRLLRQS